MPLHCMQRIVPMLSSAVSSSSPKTWALKPVAACETQDKQLDEWMDDYMDGWIDR